MLKMSSETYDILSKIQRWLPALGVLYLALCQIWGLPFGEEVNKTIIAVAAFLAATLEISSNSYHAKNVADIMYSLAYDDEDDEDEADDSEPADAE